MIQFILSIVNIQKKGFVTSPWWFCWCHNRTWLPLWTRAKQPGQDQSKDPQPWWFEIIIKDKLGCKISSYWSLKSLEKISLDWLIQHFSKDQSTDPQPWWFEIIIDCDGDQISLLMSSWFPALWFEIIQIAKDIQNNHNTPPLFPL